MRTRDPAGTGWALPHQLAWAVGASGGPVLSLTVLSLGAPVQADLGYAMSLHGGRRPPRRPQPGPPPFLRTRGASTEAWLAGSPRGQAMQRFSCDPARHRPCGHCFLKAMLPTTTSSEEPAAGESGPPPVAGGCPFLLRPPVNPGDVCLFGACAVPGPCPGPAWLCSVANIRGDQAGVGGCSGQVSGTGIGGN